MKGIHIKTAKPKRQSSLPLLQQIDVAATAQLWAKHALKPSLSQYLTHIRHANIVGALAVDRLGFETARKHIKEWDNTQHSLESRKAFAELIGLPEPYLAGVDNGFEYGRSARVLEEPRRLGLADGIAVRRLVWPNEAQD